RTVVATNPRRRTAPADDSGHDPPHFGSSKRVIRMQDQALPSIFVHHRQPLEQTTARCPVLNEIARPAVVLEPGRLSHTTVAARPRLRAEFSSLSQPHGPSQTQL